ncbi:TonB-dependent receptor [Phocaeicola abscessus]|uniref:TonB-dependent receptor n=1 Tax=Phocaeicola abscessus TaxID=555313 RepID=UPI0028E43BA4|nr:TonB-dependent receptor [Phocaeicola abscessus]
MNFKSKLSAKSAEEKQFFRKMKSFVLFWFMGMSICFASSIYSQGTLMSIKAYDQTVKEVFNLIEQNSEYIIFYMDNTVDLNRKVKIHVKNQQIEKILDELFKGTDTAYAINDRQIVIYKKELSPIVREVTEIEQTYKISGKVVDSQGEPIIGANILEKGTTNGTITDTDGNFSLNVKSITATLVVSYIGYKTNEVKVVDGKSTIIALNEDSEALDEVVVVAYGTQKARSVTAAMSKINADEFKDMPVSNLSQKLQGKISGVQILQNSGEPNGNLSIRIRGQVSINGGNSPLVVIDGFPTTSGLESLSPDEIESISVLKDAASTSLYGSRAANGVILVTTKQGKAGKTVINLTADYGISSVSSRGMPDVMNAQEFAQFKKEFYEDAQRYEGATTPVPECYAHPESVKEGTDWFKILLRTAHMQNYNLALQTGNDFAKSSVNVNYHDQEGVIVNSYAKRLSVRSNNIFNVGSRLTFGLNLSGSYIKRQLQEGLGDGRNIIESSFLMDPQLKYKNDDGTYPIAYNPPGMFANANYYLVLRDRKNPRKTIRGTASGYVKVKLIDGLEYQLSANGDVGNFSQDRWVPSYVNGGMFSAPPNPAYGRHSSFNYYTWMVENLFMYKKTFFGIHNIDALIGYSAQRSDDISSTIKASDYADDSIGFFNAAVTKVGRGSKSAWSMASWLARLNYDYKNKYILSLAFRRDGCSRFGSNARWASFPSISVGWVLTEEKFMKNISQINFLKLRGSWGKVGNNNIGNYSSLSTMSISNYVNSGAIVPGRALSGISNSSLTWETTKSWDIGLDLSFLKGRIFLMYDYYFKNTDGLLYQVDLPYTSGFSSIMSNVGEFHFWGHEFTLQTKNLIGSFKWNTDFNISFDRNKAVKLGTNNSPIGGYNNQNDYNRTAVGHQIGLFYGYVFDGVYMTPEELESQPKHETSEVGTARMKDINNDGKIDVSDRTFIGNPNPDFLFGITNTFKWRNFDASMVISGSVGNDILDETYESTENIDGVFNVRKCVKDRWRSLENPGKGEIPRTKAGTTELFRFTNSRWVYDGSYLMLKNLTIGYTFSLRHNPFVKDLRLYVSGQNLLTFTNYPGMNPEVSTGGTNGWNGYGVDYTSYPVSRIYTVGLNVTF